MIDVREICNREIEGCKRPLRLSYIINGSLNFDDDCEYEEVDLFEEIEFILLPPPGRGLPCCPYNDKGEYIPHSQRR